MLFWTDANHADRIEPSYVQYGRKAGLAAREPKHTMGAFYNEDNVHLTKADLANRNAKSAPLKPRLGCNLRFGFARALSRRFQLATGRHDILAARFADGGGVARRMDDIGKGMNPVAG